MEQSRSPLNLLIRLTGLGVFACITAQAVPILTLNPASGSISGIEGATAGWGFTITNSTNYLDITSSEFCVAPVSPPFCTTSTLGTYTDIISSELNPIVIGPGSTSVTQMFSTGQQTGIGSFHISASAVNGSSNTGEIVLTYDLFSVSPNDPAFNPALETISTDNVLTAAASITVGAATVPEPASFTMLVTMLIAGGFLLRRTRDRVD